MCNCGQTLEEKRWASVVIAAELLRLAGFPIRIGDTYPQTVCMGARWYGLPAPVVWAWPFLRMVVCWRLGVPVSESPERVVNAGCGCLVVAKSLWRKCRYMVGRFTQGSHRS